MQWVELENLPGKKMPRWQRSAGLDDDGTVFAPAALAGNEQAIMLCAAYDGFTLVKYLNHVFVSTTWLSREYPKARELCDSIERKVRKIIEQGAEEENQ